MLEDRFYSMRGTKDSGGGSGGNGEFDLSSVYNSAGNGFFQTYCKSIDEPITLAQNKTNLMSMFYGCTGFVTAPAISNFSQVTTSNGMFSGCSSLTSVPSYDMSNVTNCGSMFKNCTSLTTTPTFGGTTGSVTVFDAMFQGCSSLTTIQQLNMSSANSIEGMFRDCTSLTSVPALDFGTSQNCNYLFRGCTSLATISPDLVLDYATGFSQAFMDCPELLSINLDLPSATGLNEAFRNDAKLVSVTLNVPNAINISGAFNGCSVLNSVDFYTTSALNNLYYLFSGSGGGVTHLYISDTSGVKNFESAFYLCQFVTDWSWLNFDNGENFAWAFYYCTGLVTLPNVNMSKAKKCGRMFDSCSNLANVPSLGLTSACTDVYYMFNGCGALTDTSLNNIMGDLINTSLSATSKKLSSVGFSNSQIVRCRNLSNYQPLMNAGWSES